MFLVHPGGPFWRKKYLGAWSIPKGEAAAGEDLVAVARREFEEETGFPAPGEGALPLGCVQQRGGKIVHAWALRGDLDPARLESNVFEIEWPRGSGRTRAFPEVDAGAWFDLEEARRKILASQTPFLDALAELQQRGAL